MSTTEADPSPAAMADPADRGQLHIDDRVLRRIVEHLADQVPGTLRTGGAGPAGGERGASARISASGPDVDIAIDLAVCYPAPVRATVDEVCDRVARGVSQLTGLRVHSVEVTVSALLPRPRPRVE